MNRSNKRPNIADRNISAGFYETENMYLTKKNTDLTKENIALKFQVNLLKYKLNTIIDKMKRMQMMQSSITNTLTDLSVESEPKNILSKETSKASESSPAINKVQQAVKPMVSGHVIDSPVIVMRCLKCQELDRITANSSLSQQNVDKNDMDSDIVEQDRITTTVVEEVAEETTNFTNADPSRITKGSKNVKMPTCKVMVKRMPSTKRSSRSPQKVQSKSSTPNRVTMRGKSSNGSHTFKSSLKPNDSTASSTFTQTLTNPSLSSSSAKSSSSTKDERQSAKGKSSDSSNKFNKSDNTNCSAEEQRLSGPTRNKTPRITKGSKNVKMPTCKVMLKRMPSTKRSSRSPQKVQSKRSPWKKIGKKSESESPKSPGKETKAESPNQPGKRPTRRAKPVGSYKEVRINMKQRRE